MFLRGHSSPLAYISFGGEMKFVVVFNKGESLLFTVPGNNDYSVALRHARSWAKSERATLTSVTLVTDTSKPRQHEWVKSQPKVDGNGWKYVALACRNCPVTGRLYERRSTVTISREFRTKRRWEECHGRG